MKIRIGFGFDTHKLQKDRDLIIGGVKIPYKVGCVGHSDADVLIHAICDALLGAANLRDIGFHFPDTDAKFKDISSLILLKETKKLIASQGWKIVNIDTTIVLEQPKISTYITSMQQTLSTVLEIETIDVSIKAKTSEKLGFIGREEGISAYAVALLQQ